MEALLQDSYGRIIRSLRVSVTERCNFRCSYCKPLHQFSEEYKKNMMTFEEIERISSIFLSLGIQKIRLTGGEPLLRRGLPTLISMLKRNPGLHDLAMTTNGYFLEQHLTELKEAGLQRLTISLDTLQAKRFQEMTSVDSFEKIIQTMDKASKAGFFPLRINCVVMKGINDDELLSFAKLARDTGHIVRFIEFMPLDSGKTWNMSDVITKDQILAQLAKLGELESVERNNPSDTALHFRYKDGKGKIGIIASVTVPFCGQCSRLRLTADGKIRSCLFSPFGHDLLSPLRNGASDEELIDFIRKVTYQKPKGHKINQPDFQYPDRSMSLIGG